MTKEDKQLIVEALLFASSVEICADWEEEKLRNMIKLAESLKVQPSKDIKFYGDPNETEDPWGKEIPEKFDIEIFKVDPE